MTDQPITPPTTQPTNGAPAAPPAEKQPRMSLRERSFRFRSLVAVAIAGLLLGGGVGAAIGVVASSDDGSGRPDRGGFGGPPGAGSFDGGPGRQPPAAPQDESDS